MKLMDGIARLRLQLGAQAFFGACIGLGIFGFASSRANEPYALGLMGCGVVWMLAYAPLRRRAASLPLEDRQRPESTPRWLPKVVLASQFLSPASWFFGAWGALTLLASLFLGIMIALYIVSCNGLNLAVERRTWGAVIVMLAFGWVWNLICIACLMPILFRYF